ncbi:mRNA-decapping enzyme 1B [Rhinophrynus dorsalis]
MAASGNGALGRGLDISLAALKQHDPYIQGIVDVASQVALYTFSHRVNEWEKTDVEGTLFVYTRSASPKHGFTIMNRLSMENWTEPITKDLDFQLQDPFLLYRNARFLIYGIWFYDKEECQRIAEIMKNLTQQEQLKAQQGAGTGVSPMTLTSGEGKEVDILQMLTKAKDEYTKCKSCSEPKKITSSSAIYSNPNLIKPIAVKPNESQQKSSPLQGKVGESEPQHLSLTTLFGKSNKAQEEGKYRTDPPTARQSVVRSLSYEETGQSVENCESQLCPAIQKLMVRGPGLHPVSEIPEHRQCHNGNIQPSGDIFKGLFQPVTQPTPIHDQESGESLFSKLHGPQASVTKTDMGQPTTVHCYSKVVTSASGKGMGQVPLGYYDSSVQSQRTSVSMPSMPASSQTHTSSGAISPQELLKKLQLVRQEQQQPLPSTQRPGLAAKFPVVSQSGSKPFWVENIPGSTEKYTRLLPVISPPRIPATVSPALLMSPLVFTHSGRPSDTAKINLSTNEASAGAAGLLLSLPLPDTPACTSSNNSNESPVLTKSQLQGTLLHLIQNDESFLNTIYDTYLSVLGGRGLPGRKM